MKPNDILTMDDHLWIVSGVFLGALAQESLIGLRSHSHGDGTAYERAAEVIRDALEATLSDKRPSALTIAQALSDAGLLAGGWRPIEDAPKDGTPVLMTGPYEETSVVAWRGNEWACLADGRHAIESQCDFGTDYISLTCPTHWQPLPLPPAEG